MFCRQEFSSFKVWGVSCFLKPHFDGWPTDFVLSVVISVSKTSFPFSRRAVTGMLSVITETIDLLWALFQWAYKQYWKKSLILFWLLIDVVASVDFCSFKFHTVICLLQTSPVILYHTHECFLWYLAFFFILVFIPYIFLQPPRPSLGCFSISLSYFLWLGIADPGN